jgi:EAL domain-containing protein (putative c-di-GMP-specific phosphodiesterase class I)
LGVLRKPFTPDQLMAIMTRNGGERPTEDSRILRALSDRKIKPYYQPKIDLNTGRIVGAEALSRWHHPNRGLLGPQAYLKSKRPTTKNMIHDFTMLERATEFCAKLQSLGQDVRIAVNFAADVVLTDDFPEVVADAQRRHSIPQERLIIELTEDETTERYEELAERLLKLRLLGIQLAIDDFGTGHSSLSRLQHLPVSELKIDRSFVNGLDEYSDNLAIVRSIVDLAHSLHCEVVAEGVETVEAIEVLRQIGCDMAQGFVFSPAVNDATFVALVRDSPFVFLQGAEDTGR